MGKLRMPLLTATIALAGVILLAGCTPTTSAPKPSPTPPAATAGAAAAQENAIPGVRIPVPCGSFFTDGTATGLVGHRVVAKRDEHTVPVDIDDIANRQFGTLDCSWGAIPGEKGGDDDGLQVTIAADSVEQFARHIIQTETEQGMDRTFFIGEGARYGCESGAVGDAPLFACNGTMLVGDFWVDAYLNGSGKVSEVQARNRFEKVMLRTARILRKTTASPAGTGVHRTSKPSFCDAGNDAPSTAVQTVFGNPDLVYDFALDDPPISAGNVAETRPEYGFCYWDRQGKLKPRPNDTDFLQVQVLDSGGWAFAAFDGASPSDDEVGRYTRTTVAGAADAFVGCRDDVCNALLRVGDAAVEIKLTDRGSAENAAHLAGLVKAIAAA